MNNPLYSYEINYLVSSDKMSRQHFLGVFPRDQLPEIKDYPSSFIFNTQSKESAGEHWLAIYFDNRKHCIFFDPFGLGPKHYNLSDYIKKFSISIDFNSFQIQSLNSSVCGYFCVFFIIQKSRNKTLAEILDFFSDNLLDNDKFVVDFIKFKIN